MFFFRTLSLMFVLQRGVSSDQEVSLSCNQTVEVSRGAEVTLQCSVAWTSPIYKCGSINFTWRGDNNSDLCEKNSCSKESFTLIRLTMTVWQEENVTAGVSAQCGMDHYKIGVKMVEDKPATNESRSDQPQNLSALIVPPVVVCIGAGAGAAAALFYVIRKRRIRNRNMDQEEQLSAQNLQQEQMPE